MKEEKLLPAAYEILDKYLRNHGLRRTAERYALLDKVFASSEHFYVDELCDSMELEGYHVSRSTAYAAMQLFLDAGLVRRHQFGNQPAQYERWLPGITRSHLHLVCTVCGRVRDVRDNSIAAAITSRNYPGFKASDCAVYVYGMCGRCSRREI
ncbi:MAG: Fur family transcriptional regulator [Muribaculaceae bacterium]|nr:Fur family transcriptional regulator [Bacteroidales bacterium]MDY4811995.1 Fur family transcriptional regulator [Muribaculaceae bacterium]